MSSKEHPDAERAEPKKDSLRTEKMKDSGEQSAEVKSHREPRMQVNIRDHGELRPRKSI